MMMFVWAYFETLQPMHVGLSDGINIWASEQEIEEKQFPLHLVNFKSRREVQGQTFQLFQRKICEAPGLSEPWRT